MGSSCEIQFEVINSFVCPITITPPPHYCCFRSFVSVGGGGFRINIFVISNHSYGFLVINENW